MFYLICPSDYLIFEPNLESESHGAEDEKAESVYQPTLLGVAEVVEVLHHGDCGAGVDNVTDIISMAA